MSGAIAIPAVLEREFVIELSYSDLTRLNYDQVARLQELLHEVRAELVGRGYVVTEWDDEQKNTRNLMFVFSGE